MAAAEWKELEKLKEDFRQAQDSVTLQKLSERNCIEVVRKLEEMDILKLLHTIDGKEYITLNQLGTEIQNELYVNQGRISIVDLQLALNVNYSHIEIKVNELAAGDHDLYLVMGELVETSYLDRLAEEINDLLQSTGQITISDICKLYNLPGDFVVPQLKARFGTLIHGKMDSGNDDAIFTQGYVDRHKAYVRGRFSGITRPTTLKSMLNECNISQKLFFSIINELLSEKRIRGNLMGGNTENATFIPNAYMKLQNNWIKSFYNQNGYIEYDAIRRVGMDSPISYVKENFKDALRLSAVAVSDNMIHQLAATMEENVTGKNWLDIMQVSPIPISDQDGAQLLQHVLLTIFKDLSSGMLISGTTFASKELVDSSVNLFEAFLKAKADKDAKVKASSLTEDEMKRMANPAFMQESRSKKDKRDDRRKKAHEGSGSVQREGGGGTGIGAREVKTKGKDKKRLKRMKELEEKNREAQEEASVKSEEFFSIEEVQEIIQNEHPDLPDELVQMISQHHFRNLTDKCVEMSKSIFYNLMSGDKPGKGDDGAPQKSQSAKPRKVFEEEINILWSNITMLSSAIELFEDSDIEILLIRHLMSSFCMDIVKCLFNMMAIDVFMSVENNCDVTDELRLNILSKLPRDLQQGMSKVNSLVSGKNLQGFLEAFQDVLQPDQCDVLLKKADKKKDRQLLHSNKISLLNQLAEEEDLATALHLTVALAFQNAMGKMIHAPGKCVPAILMFLKQHVSEDVYLSLSEAQNLVMRKVSLDARESTDEEEINELANAMKICVSKLKDVPQMVKKSTAK